MKEERVYVLITLSNCYDENHYGSKIESMKRIEENDLPNGFEKRSIENGTSETNFTIGTEEWANLNNDAVESGDKFLVGAFSNIKVDENTMILEFDISSYEKLCCLYKQSVLYYTED